MTLAVVASAASASPAVAGDDLPPAIERWLDHETRLLSRDVNTARVASPTENEQAAEYAPEAARTFRVKSYWIDQGDVRVFTAPDLSRDLASRFTRAVGGRRQVRFLVHPESSAYFADLVREAEPAGDLMARATASSRTLVVWEPGHAERPIFAKVSLDRRIAGVVRTIPAGEVARSVGISTTLAAD